MEEKFDIYDFDIVSDIEAEYDSEYDAEEFIEHIKENYEQELEDDDDMPLVYIGMCVALNKRNIEIPEELKELMPKILKNKSLVGRLSENELYFKSFKKWRTKFLKSLEGNNTNEGEKEKYISPFINWRTNDIYAVDVVDSKQEECVFLRVVDNKEENGKYYPRVYLFVLPEFSKNFNIDRLDEIKYLPASTRFDSRDLYDYLHEIVDDSLRTKIETKILYIGNYELPEPMKLVDTSRSYLRSGLSLMNLNNETLERGMRFYGRMIRGERVIGGLQYDFFKDLDVEK